MAGVTRPQLRSRAGGGRADFLHRLDPKVLEALGAIAGLQTVHVQGLRDGSGTSEEILRSGNALTPSGAIIPAAAGVALITHSSGQDRGNGAGARKLRITGFDSNWDLVTRDVTLSSVAGTTTDTGGTSFRMLIDAEVIEQGANGAANAGAITVDVVGVTPTNGILNMAAGVGICMNGAFWVPPTKYCLLHAARFSGDGTAANAARFRVRKRKVTELAAGGFTADGNGHISPSTQPPWLPLLDLVTATHERRELARPMLLAPHTQLLLTQINGVGAAVGNLSGSVELTLIDKEVIDAIAAA
jgi:hypothetical protein